MKNSTELERERVDKQFFKETKSWSFDDYMKYKEKNKKATFPILIIIIVLAIGTYLAIIFGAGYYFLSQDEIRDDEAMMQLSRRICNDLNDTYFNTEIYRSGDIRIECTNQNVILTKDGN